jgi:hypothetical protein
VIKGLGVQDYKAYPNGEVKIYDNIAINNLVSALSEKNVNILGINSSDESVEEYYLNLIKEGE